MSGQQIDSLTVGVGLTQEDFEAGVQKILRSLGQMRAKSAETGESMTSSLAGVGSSVLGLGLKFAGLFIAVKGIEDVVGYFKDLSKEFASLAVAGEYLGQSSAQLYRFGEVAKLAGGNAQDAISSVQSLQSAIFGLEFQGQISQNLLQLQRLGVGYLTTAGQMRPLKDIALETAAALQGQLPTMMRMVGGKLVDINEPMRVQWAAQIFGAGGLANAVGGGLAELRSFYGRSAHDNKSVTDRMLDAQRTTQQDLVSLSYALKNEAAKALNRLTPAIRDLIKTIHDLIPVIDEAITDILHPVQAVVGKGNAYMISEAFHDWWSGKDLQPLMRENIVAEKIPDTVMGRFSKDVVADETAQNVLKILHFDAGGDEGDPNWSKAVTKYLSLYSDTTSKADFARAKTEGRAGAIARPHAHALSTPGASRPHATSAAASKSTASTGGPRVQIGSIGPIYTQARDANGLMAGINAAAQRKLLVAQSDPGLA